MNLPSQRAERIREWESRAIADLQELGGDARNPISIDSDDESDLQPSRINRRNRQTPTDRRIELLESQLKQEERLRDATIIDSPEYDNLSKSIKSIKNVIEDHRRTRNSNRASMAVHRPSAPPQRTSQ